MIRYNWKLLRTGRGKRPLFLPFSGPFLAGLNSFERPARTPIPRPPSRSWLVSLPLSNPTLVALRTEDIDLTEGTIRILTKGGAERVVFVNSALRRQLRQYLKNRKRADEAVFQSARGGASPASVCRLAQGSRDHQTLLGPLAPSHRHAATLLYESTKDLRLVQNEIANYGVFF